MATGRIPINGTAAIQQTIVDAKGDLIAGTAADAVSRLAIGSNNTVLTADSAEATGMKWAAAASASGPAFRAYRATSDQVTTEDAYTKLQFNAESFDTDSCFDSTTNYRFTPNKAGYYNFNVGLRFLTNDLTEVRIYKNGSAAAQLYAQTVSTNITANGSALLYANGTTDYFEIFAYLASATSRNLDDGEIISFFDGVWIRS